MRMLKTAVLAAAVSGLFALPLPAHAQTAYEMFGQGVLVAQTAGMAFCPAECAPDDSNVYGFSSLPINGVGALFGQPVAGTYDCGASTVTVDGDTSNFEVHWAFSCPLTAGVGPTPIEGHFDSIAPAVPVFTGEFIVGENTVGSVCAGMFVPTQMNGNRIASALFAGECTAAGA